ncbi:efflux RND transporter periplasmic adaptor subunit [Maricaulis virginensis]|uniref:Membrane protein n=1 Tax=Maricaulis virginensis TaxID=144022 RepID=A0A9W6ILJ8_9PROT|nr:HlyD family efflux transporter periplasmic adaptor subunit [Maricaulis virginensis]GLK52532.1 membrane protein [Maricaulis virginensis]
MKLSFRTVFWGSAALIVIVLLVLAFRPRPVPVDMGEVMSGPMSVTVSDEGRTRIRDVYAVAAPVGGRLLRVAAEAGDAVAAGDVVARLLPSEPAFLDARTEAEARAAVDLAEAGLAASRADAESTAATLELARSEHARIRALFDSGIASQAQLDRVASELRAARAADNRARASVNMRQAEVEAARVRLLGPDGAPGGNGSVLDIRAPVGGVVLRVLQESETPLAPGAVVMEIGDPADLEVVAEFLSTEAVQVEAGAAARITDWGAGDDPLPARVRRVEPYGFLKVSALGVEEQRVNVILDFDAPADSWRRLGHGYRIEAAITVWETGEAVQVPVAALFREDGSWAVYRVEDGRARLTPVEIGHDNGETAEVLSGIEPGRRIILYPGAGLSDGVRVELRDPE